MFNSSIITSIDDFLDRFSSLFFDSELAKSLEIYNLTDDNVIYICIYAISMIILFLLAILTNFYRIKPSKVK